MNKLRKLAVRGMRAADTRVLALVIGMGFLFLTAGTFCCLPSMGARPNSARICMAIGTSYTEGRRRSLPEPGGAYSDGRGRYGDDAGKRREVRPCGSLG